MRDMRKRALISVVDDDVSSRVSMPGMSGPQLQCELSRRELHIPIIFITGYADRNLRANLLARSAVECLFKPFSEKDLRAALEYAVAAARYSVTSS